MSLIITDSSAPKTLFEELLIQDQPVAAMDIFWAVQFWIKTGNPHFMDYALTVCDREPITIGPLLQAELVKAAKARLRGSTPGEAAQVHGEVRRFGLAAQMVHYTWKGMNQTQAAEKVFNSYEGEKPSYSVLYRQYSELMTTTGEEKNLHELLDELFNQH